MSVKFEWKTVRCEVDDERDLWVCENEDGSARWSCCGEGLRWKGGQAGSFEAAKAQAEMAYLVMTEPHG
jgi:hypothetical protein